MQDKIIEAFKKYSKSVDTEYNVYNCLIEEDWSNIAQEVVKLFCQPAVMSSVCKCKGGAVGRTVTADFEHQICDRCGNIAN
jgi:hypothetical protein